MSVDSAANTTGLHMGEFLIPKTSDLGDRHFIIRSLYKKLILMRSYKSNLYVDTFVTVAFYCMPGPILSVFPALIVHSELKNVHLGFPVAFIF